MYRKGYVRAGQVLHDVQLWAGAYVIDPNQKYEERMRASYQLSIVNGRVVNVYSFADNVLTFGQRLVHQQEGTTAIGIQEILIDVPEDDNGELGCKKVLNLDCTKEAGDHQEYFDNVPKFIELIPFGY